VHDRDIYWTFSFVIDLQNSLMALNVNSNMNGSPYLRCFEIHSKANGISDALKYTQKQMANMQHKMTLLVTHTFVVCATIYYAPVVA